MGISTPEVIWSEIGPHEHFCQFYEDDAVLLDTIDGFIGPGLNAGEAAIVIAVPDHLQCLTKKLERRGLDVAALIAADQFIALDAAERPDQERAPFENTAPEEFRAVLSEVYRALRKQNLSPLQARTRLVNMELFREHPALIDAIDDAAVMGEG